MSGLLLLSVRTAYGSHEELLKDADVDVIYIATPDAQHAPHALQSLRAGKPCLVEKPFADSAAAAAAVVAESERTGLFVMEALWTRHVPAIEEALQLISAGRIGEVLQLTSDFGCQYAIPAGALNALGVYGIALSQMVFEADARRERHAAAESTAVVPIPSSLQAHGSLRSATDVDDCISVQMRYGARAQSSFTSSLLINGPNEATVCGTMGRIRMHSPMWHATHQLTLTDSNGQEQQPEFGHRELPLSSFSRSFNLLLSQRLVHEAAEVARCIRSGLRESPKWPLAQSMQVMQIMDLIRKQIRQ
jgi:predicted dehydrogenase